MTDYQAGTGYLQILPSTRGFAQRLKREMAGVAQDYTVTVRPELDRGAMTSLQAAIRSLPAVVLDADATPADREIAGLRARMERLSDLTIGVDISGEQARREIDAIRADLDRLGRESPDIAVRVDTGAATAALAGFNREMSRVDGRTARAQIDVDTAAAVASLAVLAFAVNQFANREYSFTLHANTFGAVASVAALAAKVTALGGLAGVVGGLGGALAGVGAAGAVAAGGLGAAVLASLGVGKALTALSAQQDAAGNTASASAKKQQSSAYAIASAQDRVTQAMTNAGRVRQSVADGEDRAAQQVQRAEENLQYATVTARQRVAAAVEQASKSIAAAEKQQDTAQRALGRATTDLRREQGTLTDAWEEGRRALQDLQDQVDGNALDQRQAALDLKDAKKELDAARASGDADAIDRAQLAYDRQVETIDQLGKQTQRLTAENTKSQAAGVAGSKSVVDANERIAAATERQADAARAAGEADAAVTTARIDGEKSVRQARAEGDRQIAQARQQRDDAEASARQQEIQGRQQLADADRQVLEANRALTQALAQTGDEGSAAADKVAQAFADLSPAAAAFAMYLFGLQPLLKDLSGVAATEFFPPLQAGIGLLVAQAPLISGVVSQLAGAMGSGLNMVLTALASPFWLGFFQLLGNAAGTVIPALFGVLMNLAHAAAVLLTGLLPLAPAGFALLNQFAALLVVLSPFLVTLLSGLIPAASAFLTALLPLGPVLAALQPILLVLGQLLSVVLGAFLTALAPVLVALTPLIQAFATQLATSLVGSLQTLTPLLVAVATWLGQNPGLVLGVIGAVGTLVGAFKPLLFILGLAVSWLHSFLIIQVAKAALVAFGLEGSVAGTLLLKLLSPIDLLKMALPLLGKAAAFLGRMLLTALGPVGILITLLGALYTGNEAFRNAINGLLGVIGTLVGQLLGALMPILDAVGQVVSMLAGVFSQLVGQLAAALIPVITALAGVLTQLVGALLPPLMSIVSALVPVIMLLATVFVQLLTGAVVPLISMFAQLISAVLPPLVSVLSGVVIPVIAFLANVLAKVLVWVITNILIPAISAIVPTLRWLGDAAMWLWTNAIKPAFDFIAAAAQILFAILFTVLVAPAIFLFNLLAAAATWLWDSAIRPAFQAIGDFVTWVWTALLKPAFDAIVWFWQNVLAPAATWLYQNVIAPIFNAIGAVVAWVWLNVIKPNLDAWVWFFQNVIAPAALWLWHNVIEPIFTGIGNSVKAIYDNIIHPAFSALVDGVNWVKDGFQTAVDWIGRIWDGLKRLLAVPINFLIETVFNNGIRKAWNFAADLLPGVEPIAEIPKIPEYRSGGLLHGPGTGTSDSILGLSAGGIPTARVSNGEFVVREAVTKKTLPFLTALNDGNGEALQAAGGLARVAKRYQGDSAIGMLAAGGPVEQRITDAKKWLSGDARGIPYVWGGGSSTGMDCSGMQAAVVHVLSGRSPYSGRIGTTASMPWGGFVPGLDGSYAVGNKPADHMAGTLAGDNVEQHGPNGTPFAFPSRWGADNGYFPQKFHLGEVGGQFVSGGNGSGGGNWILDQVRGIFDDVTNPVLDLIRAFMGEPPPQFRRIPVETGTSIRDNIRDFLFGEAETAGGNALDVAGITGPVVDQVRQVATKYGWGQGPEWDALAWIVAKESSWDPNAASPISSARGLFQKMTGTYGPVEDTPAGQAAWGLDYIAGRYGTPSAAKAFHQSHNWYDGGGIARGRGLMFKNVIPDERVLDPLETQAYPTLTRLSQQFEEGRLGPTPTVPASDIDAMTRSSTPEWPTEFRLTSGRLEFDEDGLVRIVDGRIEAESNLLTAGRKT